VAHNHEVTGSNPVSATNYGETMQQRIIWQTPEGRVFIGREVEQLGLCMLFVDQSFGTFAEYVGYVKCRVCGLSKANAEVMHELKFIEHIFSKQDKVGQSHFPTAFQDLVAGLEAIDNVTGKKWNG
jgi:hypothetical protein